MKRWVILVICLVLASLTASAQLSEQQQIQKLNLVYQQIRSNYVDNVPLEPLVQEAVIATLRQLDPHSSYLDHEQMAALRTRLRGEFAGVGIRYIVHRDTLVVRGVVEGSPAERANIKATDRIVAIDGRPIVGITTDSVSQLLRGNAGSNVCLTIKRRSTNKPLDIKLKRANIESSAITASFRIGDVGYIAISKFSKPLASEFLTALKSLGDISSLVVDLRDNSGGAITSAIDLTGLFLRKGDVIVSTEGRTNNIVYDTKRDGTLVDLPLVVIINENSASASEIFAGAIQDHDRGVVIGHTSYGKGLVQRVIDFKDGTGMCLTVARYKTPSGRIIQRPYVMGQGEEYMSDTLRYMHPDSIPHNHKLLFKTLHRGRTVYGGGGITPDIYIDTDGLKLSPSLTSLYRKGLFEHLSIDIWDCISTEELLSSYSSVETFDAHYKMDSRVMELFYQQTGLAAEVLTSLDHSFIRAMILSTIAERLYGTDARYYIYNNSFDPLAREAIAIAQNQERIEEILQGDR